MDTVITLWAITLLIAYLLLVPLLGIVTRFLRHAREVDRLALVTLEAAKGVASHTGNIPLLDLLLAKAGSIASTSAAIDGVAAAIHDDAGRIVAKLAPGANDVR